MIRLSKKERAVQEKLEIIHRNLLYTQIYLEQKAYLQASTCAKCVVQLIAQVDKATIAKKPKPIAGDKKL